MNSDTDTRGELWGHVSPNNDDPQKEQKKCFIEATQQSARGDYFVPLYSQA